MAHVTGHTKLVQRQRGSHWYVKYRLPNGSQVQKKLGPAWTERSRPPAGYFTKRLADEALQEILSDARRGTLAGVNVRTGRTFEDACMEWLRYVEHDRDRARATVRDYTYVVNGALRPEFDGPLEKVTTERIDAYRDRLLSEGRVSRRTIEKNLVLLHGILKRAKRKGWIATNPAEDVERVHPKRSGDFNVLSSVEVQAVARVASDQVATTVILVAAFTGLRLGELRALRWGDVDFAGSFIHVRRNLPSHGDEKVPKSGKVRSVPLIDQAARALDGLSRREHYTGPDDRVFVSPTGGPFDGGDVRDEFYACLKRAGFGALREKDNPMTFHDLRHTAGTLMIRVWDLNRVRGYLGHADVQTTMIYLHHQPRTADAAALSALVASDVSPDVSRTAVNGAQQSETTVAA
jgi:integrase